MTIIKTHSNLSERFQILVASAPQRSCTAWQTGQADPRSKLRLWRELSKPKYKAFDLASALAPPKAAGLLERVIDHNRGFKIIEPWLATKNLSHPPEATPDWDNSPAFYCFNFLTNGISNP